MTGGSDQASASTSLSWVRTALGEGLRETRRARGLTQMQLAVGTGMSRGYVAEIEGGKVNVPAETVVRLAEALDVLPSKLLNTVDAEARARRRARRA